MKSGCLSAGLNGLVGISHIGCVVNRSGIIQPGDVVGHTAGGQPSMLIHRRRLSGFSEVCEHCPSNPCGCVDKSHSITYTTYSQIIANHTHFFEFRLIKAR